MSDASHPRLQYDVEYPEELSRGLVLIKWWLLIIPHAIVLAVLGLIVSVITVIAWFAILITGKYPEGMWKFSLGVLRWGARVNAYRYLQRDEYPPFAFEGSYPVTLELDYPPQLNRWLVLVKWLLLIPHFIALYFISAIVSIITFIVFFAILFTGKYPRGMFDFTVGFGRWSSRVAAYSLLLTDDYPPFSFDAGSTYTPGPSSGPTAVSYR
jgi:hypothetical protein